MCKTHLARWNIKFPNIRKFLKLLSLFALSIWHKYNSSIWHNWGSFEKERCSFFPLRDCLAQIWSHVPKFGAKIQYFNILKGRWAIEYDMMNEYDRFLRRFYFATRTQKRRRIIVKNQRLISGRSKIISRKADGRPGTTFLLSFYAYY